MWSMDEKNYPAWFICCAGGTYIICFEIITVNYTISPFGNKATYKNIRGSCTMKRVKYGTPSNVGLILSFRFNNISWLLKFWNLLRAVIYGENIVQEMCNLSELTYALKNKKTIDCFGFFTLTLAD